MSRVLIWDLPTRLFHWLLAVGILVAFGIAQFGGKHGPLFHHHAIIGIVLGATVLLRLVWGFIGTKHARFASFAFGPTAVASYFKDTVAGRPSRHAGHNPASSWAIYAMLALMAVVVGSGLLMGTGNEASEDVHAAAVYTLLAVAGVHVAGVILHTIRYREKITLAMITGRKEASPSASIRSARPLSGITFLVLVLLLGGGLYSSYDPASGRTTLPIISTSIRLRDGEGEVRQHTNADRERSDHNRHHLGTHDD